ncbi:class I SAM-dependent methyltransferase [Amylibacter sp.]|nr:class I SAM-dependent methyltransferase [Amylibacter sp.]
MALKIDIERSKNLVVDCLKTNQSKIVQDLVINKKNDKNRIQIGSLIDTYLEESIFMLSIIEPYLEHLKVNARVLEVGAGTGLLSHILVNAGYKVTSIEPGANSFGFMPALSKAIASSLISNNILTAEIQAEIIESFKAPRFDFVFSAHVLEHVSDKKDTFTALSNLLCKNGLMVHLCPNYTIPFEPHVGHFIIPLLGRANRHIFRRSYNESTEIWNGVNFITGKEVKKLAALNGLEVNFKRNVLKLYLDRFAANTKLSNRHSGLIFKFFVKLFNMLHLHLFIPGSWQSPMLFELSSKKARH